MPNIEESFPEQKALFTFIETPSETDDKGQQVEGWLVENHACLKTGNHKKTVATVIYTTESAARADRQIQLRHGVKPPMPVPVIITIHKPIIQ